MECVVLNVSVVCLWRGACEYMCVECVCVCGVCGVYEA